MQWPSPACNCHKYHYQLGTDIHHLVFTEYAQVYTPNTSRVCENGWDHRRDFVYHESGECKNFGHAQMNTFWTLPFLGVLILQELQCAYNVRWTRCTISATRSRAANISTASNTQQRRGLHGNDWGYMELKCFNPASNYHCHVITYGVQRIGTALFKGTKCMQGIFYLYIFLIFY